jgi:hypothetical protein
MDSFMGVIWTMVGGIGVMTVAAIWSDWKQAKSSKEAVDLYGSLPDVVSYLNQQPHARTPTGPRCYKCESNHLGNFAVFKKTFLDLGLRSKKEAFLGRIHFCKRCDTKLYHTESDVA